MHRSETAARPAFLPLPPLRSAEILPPAPSAVELLPAPHRAITPFPASGMILALARSADSSQPSERVGRYDHLRQRYDEPLKRLGKLRRRLKPSLSQEGDTPDELSCEVDSPEVVTYPTPLGILSFPELVERTRRYAASVLRHTYQVNEADLNDGLQAGCLKLWQRLQKEPELLQDKSLAWIGKGIIFTALHATRGDWQFRRQTQANGEVVLQAAANVSTNSFAPHSRESRQADIRADLQGAVVRVERHIRQDEKGKRQEHDLWSLYGLAVLQISASEASRLVEVREQSMQAAYKRVRGWLQEALPHYAPMGETKVFRQHGREALPQQDMKMIRKVNGEVSDEVYLAVQRLIEATHADTRQQDERALEGIREGIPAQAQARTHGLPTWRMQRAYDRVHLMIAAQHDPSVRMRRPERRVKRVFTLTPESEIAVEQLALELLRQPKSYEKLVALHAHIGNLAISTTAKHFNIPTSTLRYYTQQIGAALGTPIQPARSDGTGKRTAGNPASANPTSPLG